MRIQILILRFFKRVKAPPTRIRVNKYAGSKMFRFEWTTLDLPSALNETLKGTIVLL